MGNVRNVKTLNTCWNCHQPQNVPQNLQISLGNHRRWQIPEKPFRRPSRFLQILHQISQRGRFFKIPPLRRLPHRRLQILSHLLGLPFQKFTSLLHPLSILLTRYSSHARGTAVLDHMIQAVTIIPLSGNLWTTRSQTKFPPHERQRLTQGPRVGKRPKVPRLILPLHPRGLKLGKWFVHIHPDHQKSFVVPKTHIVPRPILFDQPSLQQNGLRLALHFMRLQFRDAFQQCSRF